MPRGRHHLSDLQLEEQETPVVTRRIRVLLKDAEPVFNRFYTQESPGNADEITWAAFQRLLKTVGFSREVKRMSALKLEPDMAKAIDRAWTRIGR
jgi:hypothetical protein